MTESISQSNAEFLEAFRAKGYQPIGVQSAPAQGGWYRFKGSTDQATHVAFLDYKTAARSYGVWLTAFNEEALRRLRRSLPCVLRYLRPVFALGDSTYFDRPHWMLFNAGRALGWPLLTCPHPLDRDNWAHQLDELTSILLEPIFWKVKSMSDIEQLLFRDDIPFEWSVSAPVLRAAEIVSLTKISGADRELVTQRILSFKSVIILGMYGSSDCEKMIDEFFEGIN